MNDIHTIAPTMTSLEIAALVDSRHDKVRQSIERLADRGAITLPPLGEVSNDGPGPKTISVYLIGKRDSYVIVAQLSPEFTARLVDRWQELEAGALPALPRTFSEALRALADKTDLAEQQAAALAMAAPKVEFVDRYVQANTSSMGVREVVKLLKTNGHTVNEHSFTAWLVDRGFMYRKKAAPGKLGTLTPSAQHEAAGRFDTKTGQGHSGINVPVHKFTGKGVEWIVGEWAKHQIRAEVAA